MIRKRITKVKYSQIRYNQISLNVSLHPKLLSYVSFTPPQNQEVQTNDFPLLLKINVNHLLSPYGHIAFMAGEKGKDSDIIYRNSGRHSLVIAIKEI